MRDELLNLLIQKSNGTLDAGGSARIEQILEQDPALLAEYEAWQAELPTLKELAGLAGATSLNAPAMPDSIREELLEHLQEKFDHTKPELTRPQSPDAIQRVAGLGTREVTWRWALIPAFGLAVLFLISLNKINQEPIPASPPKIAQPQAGPPMIQIALLDVVGQTRGTNDPIRVQLQNAWPETELIDFDQTSKMKAWRDDWPTSTASVIKIIYNVSSGELILTSQIKGENKKETFTLTDPQELPVLIEKAQATLKTWLEETDG